ILGTKQGYRLRASVDDVVVRGVHGDRPRVLRADAIPVVAAVIRAEETVVAQGEIHGFGSAGARREAATERVGEGQLRRAPAAAIRLSDVEAVRGSDIEPRVLDHCRLPVAPSRGGRATMAAS